ncbi:fungal-specific transcription factor domain-containing protein [Rhexocercosporidium sp. MPI-PUGE-AT-0058]|nr:fungal-specific transcription factor domain-containing protein [Rhexocercosporidium sp. MPI-PUGE-AT-0058]
MPSIEDDIDEDTGFDFNSSAFTPGQGSLNVPDYRGETSVNVEHRTSEGKQGASGQLPPHRNACAICRKRKLKCDGAAPECGRCKRLGHECVYVESRRKSGPKRGYVKGLESRLAQVEGLLKEKEGMSFGSIPGAGTNTSALPNFDPLQESYSQPLEYGDTYLRNSLFLPDLTENVHFDMDQVFKSENLESVTGKGKGNGNDGSSWALSELGVQEPLPPQDIVDELTQLYFEKIHPSNDMIHQYRFMASLSLSSSARPSIALRYSMWTLAAGISPSHKHLSPLFYLRTRKYAEADEAGSRAKYVNIRHAQTWILIGTYEYKMLMFPKSWLSIGKAVRLCQMLGLHRLDGRGLGHRQALEAPGDVTEKEERRRTFWMAFGMDRYAAVSTGWPVIVDERDILTFLPSSESAFETGEEEPGIFLQDAMQPLQATSLSSFAGVVVVCSLIGRIFEHLSRPNPLDLDSDPNSDFWRSHRKIENVLLNMVLHLPAHLRLPTGASTSNTIFLNMTLQSATICLHQAAIAKAEKVPAGCGYESVVEESKTRCAAAAHEIASIMKRIAHFDLSTLHPYIPFPLYLSARIFAQMAKANPQDDNANSLVRFLLSALVAMKEVNPLVESYLAQLDMEDLGLSALQENVRMFGLERSVVSLVSSDYPSLSTFTVEGR